MVLRHSGFKIVLTGDNPASKLEEMLKADFRKSIANATVLLAPHHGVIVISVKVLLNGKSNFTVISDKSIQHETQTYSAIKVLQFNKRNYWGAYLGYVFTTRNDGTITFNFNIDGTWSINTSTSEY